MDIFKELVDLIFDKVKKGELFILLSPPFDISIEPAEDEIPQNMAETLRISEEEFNSQVTFVETLLLAVLEERVQEYIEARVKHDIEARHILGDEESDRRRELQDQARILEKKLVGDRLRERYILKAMSKAPFFSDIEWDIKLKTADSTGDIRFPYATLRIRYQREFEWAPHLMLGGRAFDSVQLNLCKEELLYLQQSLKKSLGQLIKAEEDYGIYQT